jgi:hypothetical protein
MGGVTLNWILGCGLHSSGSGQCPVTGCCEHGNAPLGSIWKVTTLLHGVSRLVGSLNGWLGS